MGIYDRDYIRTSGDRGGLADFRTWSVTTWLIVANVAVFLIDPLIDYPMAKWGYFSQDMAVTGLQIWRFITFQFLHANGQHILFNMIALYFFGPIVESYLGARKYLAFYLLSGVGGPLAYMLLNALGFFHDGAETPLVGASAGIFGVLIGAARVAPDVGVLMMMVVPMRLRTLAWVLVAIAAGTVLYQGRNAGGEAAHLGGAAVGLLLIQNDRWLDFFNFRCRHLKYGGRHVQVKDWSKDFNR